MSNSNDNTRFVDVRALPPPLRHKEIFRLAGELAAGRSFILVNDHDPEPLHHQLESKWPKQFSWSYVERGPDVWCVQIGKLVTA